jgi:hypothetical protein
MLKQSIYATLHYCWLFIQVELQLQNALAEIERLKTLIPHRYNCSQTWTNVAQIQQQCTIQRQAMMQVERIQHVLILSLCSAATNGQSCPTAYSRMLLYWQSEVLINDTYMTHLLHYYTTALLLLLLLVLLEHILESGTLKANALLLLLVLVVVHLAHLQSETMLTLPLTTRAHTAVASAAAIAVKLCEASLTVLNAQCLCTTYLSNWQNVI